MHTRRNPRRSLRWWRDLAELVALGLVVGPFVALFAVALRWLGFPLVGWP